MSAAVLSNMAQSSVAVGLPVPTVQERGSLLDPTLSGPTGPALEGTSRLQVSQRTEGCSATAPEPQRNWASRMGDSPGWDMLPTLERSWT